MRLFIYATSTDSINFLAAISGATIKCLVAFGRRTSNIINVYRTVALKHTTVIIRSIGLDEIGLCTSTRWSPGTWQLLLMFHLDRVNRLPKQTPIRVYGCAARAQRCGGGGVKIFRWGVSPSKSLNTATTSTTYTFGHSNRQASPSGVLPPSYEYYIHRTAQHLHIYTCNPRPERSRGPPF